MSRSRPPLRPGSGGGGGGAGGGTAPPQGNPRVIPTEFLPSKLRACLSCSLIKTTEQFLLDGCDNCDFLDMAGSRDRVGQCTSGAFVGIAGVAAPADSWVGRWQRLGRGAVAGCYAIGVDAKLPEDIRESLEDNGYRVARTRATALDEE